MDVRSSLPLIFSIALLYSVGCASNQGGDEESDRRIPGAFSGGSVDDPPADEPSDPEDGFGNGEGTAGSFASAGNGAIGHNGDGDAGCGATSLEAEQIIVEEVVEVATEITEVKPVALYIMLDKSLSMDWGGLWDPAVTALKSFINDADSAGIHVGLQYFPSGG